MFIILGQKKKYLAYEELDRSLLDKLAEEDDGRDVDELFSDGEEKVILPRHHDSDSDIECDERLPSFDTEDNIFIGNDKQMKWMKPIMQEKTSRVLEKNIINTFSGSKMTAPRFVEETISTDMTDAILHFTSFYI